MCRNHLLQVDGALRPVPVLGDGLPNSLASAAKVTGAARHPCTAGAQLAGVHRLFLVDYELQRQHCDDSRRGDICVSVITGFVTGCKTVITGS
jgi:hypothetical protein